MFANYEIVKERAEQKRTAKRHCRLPPLDRKLDHLLELPVFEQ